MNWPRLMFLPYRFRIKLDDQFQKELAIYLRFPGWQFWTQTSILSRTEGLSMYIPALILLDTYSYGFSTNLWIRPFSGSYTTIPYLEGSSTFVTWEKKYKSMGRHPEGYQLTLQLFKCYITITEIIKKQKTKKEQKRSTR